MRLMTATQRKLADGEIKTGEYFLNDPPTGVGDNEARAWICVIHDDGYEDTQIVVFAPHGDRLNEEKAKQLAERIVRALNADGGLKQ